MTCSVLALFHCIMFYSVLLPALVCKLAQLSPPVSSMLHVIILHLYFLCQVFRLDPPTPYSERETANEFSPFEMSKTEGTAHTTRRASTCAPFVCAGVL